MKFLLSHTPTTDYRVELEDTGMIRISKETRFEMLPRDADKIAWFLQAVLDDKSVRHTYTDNESVFVLDYDPDRPDLEKFTITRRLRSITMSLGTAAKLLAALTGKTEGLVRDE